MFESIIYYIAVQLLPVDYLHSSNGMFAIAIRPLFIQVLVATRLAIGCLNCCICLCDRCIPTISSYCTYLHLSGMLDVC